MNDLSITNLLLQNGFYIIVIIFFIAVIIKFFPKKKSEKQLILDELIHIEHKIFMFAMMGRVRGNIEKLENFYKQNKKYFSFDMELSYKNTVNFYKKDEYFIKEKPGNMSEVNAMKSRYNKINSDFLKSIKNEYKDNI